MTEEPGELPVELPAERRGPAQLTNLRIALHAINQAQEGGDGSPRFAVLYGPSGYGKSVAAAFVASRFDAGYVTAMATSTQRSLLEAIAAEVGVSKPERTTPRLVAQVIEALTIDPRPLIIDEMDYIVTKRFADIIRDIHDHTSVPILLIGEETLPAKLKAWERFDNRIVALAAAQPASVEDAMLLRDHYCTRARPANDLVAAIVERCRGVTRRIVVNLRAAQTVALELGRNEIDLAGWGKRPMLTGDLPSVRRKVAA